MLDRNSYKNSCKNQINTYYLFDLTEIRIMISIINSERYFVLTSNTGKYR